MHIYKKINKYINTDGRKGLFDMLKYVIASTRQYVSSLHNDKN